MLLAQAEVSAKAPNQNDEALALCKQALDLSRTANNDKLEAKVWLTRAKILISKDGKKDDELLKEADQAANDAMSIFQRLGDQKGEAEALHIAGSVKACGGNMAEALDFGLSAVDIFQDLSLR